MKFSRRVYQASSLVLIAGLLLPPFTFVEAQEAIAPAEASTEAPTEAPVVTANVIATTTATTTAAMATTTPEAMPAAPTPVSEPATEPATEEEAPATPESEAPALNLPEGAEYIPGEVLVKFKERHIDLEDRGGEAGAEDVAATLDLEVVETITDANLAIIDTGTDDPAEAIAALEADPNVEFAEPNYVYRIEAIDTDDTQRALLWGLENTGQTVDGVIGTADADIDAPESWELSRGAGVIVAVIDTGVDYTQPDLAANMWDGEACVNENGAALGDCIHGYDFYRNDADPAPENSHGTHVAGTIAAVMDNGTGTIGVAPETKIMALRTDFIHNEETVLSTADIVRAIDFARHNGAQVINASFGSSASSTAMHDAIDRFGDAGGIFVASAGNDERDTDALPYYPAGFDLPNVISVAASDQNDELADFSSYGATSVDIAAPGVNILSTVPDGWDYKNGTSMAAPHVVGIAAQLFAYDPDISVASLKQAILTGGDAIAGLAGNTLGGKRANAFGALDSLGLATTSTLAVEISVVNDHNGTATSSDFAFSVNGAASQSVSAGTASTSFIVEPGRYHDVVGTAATGYGLTAASCMDVVLAAGATATCTLTYDDTAPVVSGGGGGGGGSRRGGGGGSSNRSSDRDDEEEEEERSEEQKEAAAPEKLAPGEPLFMELTTPAAYRFVLDRGQGAQGADITELQGILRAAGYLAVAPTGYFGPMTADALRRYQAAKSLPATGVLDAATRATLNAAPAASFPLSGAAAANRALIEAQLTLLKQQLLLLLMQLVEEKR